MKIDIVTQPTWREWPDPKTSSREEIVEFIRTKVRQKTERFTNLPINEAMLKTLQNAVNALLQELHHLGYTMNVPWAQVYVADRSVVVTLSHELEIR